MHTESMISFGRLCAQHHLPKMSTTQISFCFTLKHTRHIRVPRQCKNYSTTCAPSQLHVELEFSKHIEIPCINVLHIRSRQSFSAIKISSHKLHSKSSLRKIPSTDEIVLVEKFWRGLICVWRKRVNVVMKLAVKMINN